VAIIIGVFYWAQREKLNPPTLKNETEAVEEKEPNQTDSLETVDKDLEKKYVEMKQKIAELNVRADASDLEDADLAEILAEVKAILADEEIKDASFRDLNKQASELVDRIEEKHRVLAERREAGETKAAEAEKVKESETDRALKDYSAKEIEYARIILMTGFPNGSKVYVTKSPAGTSVTAGYEETVKYPEAIVTLSGDHTADGMFTYAPQGGGYIKVYPVPSHWHQEDQSPEGYQKYAREILEEAEIVYIEPGNPEKLLEKLKTTEFDHWE